MGTEHRDQLIKEIRELERRLRLVERKAAALQRRGRASPRAAFRSRYPQIGLDPRLFRLVGMDPPLSLEEEKRAIREAIAARSETR